MHAVHDVHQPFALRFEVFDALFERAVLLDLVLVEVLPQCGTHGLFGQGDLGLEPFGLDLLKFRCQFIDAPEQYIDVGPCNQESGDCYGLLSWLWPQVRVAPLLSSPDAPDSVRIGLCGTAVLTDPVASDAIACYCYFLSPLVASGRLS